MIVIVLRDLVYDAGVVHSSVPYERTAAYSTQWMRLSAVKNTINVLRFNEDTGAVTKTNSQHLASAGERR